MSRGIIFVLAGILLQVVDFPLDIGFITVNLLSDIVAYILILLGLKPFLKEQNRVFSDCFRLIIGTLFVEILRTLSTTIDFGTSTKTVNLIFVAVTSLCFMRFVYSYAESILLQAKFMKIEVPIAPLRSAFSAFCVLIAVDYFILTFDYALLTVVAHIILAICAFHYCNVINNIRTTLYPKNN